MIIYEDSCAVVIENVKDFNIHHIFSSGQSVRWKKQKDNSYICVVKDKIINVSQIDDILYFKNTNLDDVKNFWVNYFGLDVNYSIIKKEILNISPNLSHIIDFGSGLRILNQDEWETLITLILSANNSMQILEKVVDNLCSRYGDYIGEYEGEKYYSFPTPNKLSSLSLDELRECKVGFRDKYIKSTSTVIYNNDIDLYNLNKLDTKSCLDNLRELSGVGEKVADCVAMLSMKKYDVFAVDVWIKRIMEDIYFSNKSNSVKKIRSFAVDKFGDLSSFVQQYLFFFARQNKVGKS
ncbi:DNA-3-methyladenine glycosylase family protein [Terrisporobacter mayombei]|uniref:DNA-(apurinic or apyrimidinic site) lyase n=1 Tax=Terrisporobacter mayombei TaxID=1541 RepID=A0ABY9Q095_9FIRM|nr:DNA glycosylase [Terrisporobacter mayombei]MCC3866804.1 8-oxoguanine DNA glycosylase [Terrisporobacter mayombei]WMT81044.1 Endonuclease III [Terrisporobacter mayombei]